MIMTRAELVTSSCAVEKIIWRVIYLKLEQLWSKRRIWVFGVF